jgi:cytochrome d ubiquinol oxidase subunit I
MGWIVAELGRQPWIIEGVLPTAMAVSSLGAGELLLTIAGFTLFYSVLFVIEMGLMLRAIRKGPQPDHDPVPPSTPLPAAGGAARPFPAE